MSNPNPHAPKNRLANETSPYLKQHQHNPVDWFPWGPEALERAKTENKPIFLSVGYSACHWCHVMERESFENPHIASIMNDNYINIKVDREERPDIDQIYMSAVQVLTGRGGWPMSVFLTPNLEPFYGGTYFPPTDSRGLPGFDRVLHSVAKAWRDQSADLIHSAAELTAELQRSADPKPADTDAKTRPIDEKTLTLARDRLANSFDPRHGGFGAAPKFPHPMDLRLLLRVFARSGNQKALDMVRKTLDCMMRGGIHDHLGGGFARYSTDEEWLVPHFEKMLYDNALLAATYTEAFQATRDEPYANTARTTLNYIITRMKSPEGGFYSAEDADSEGVEGKFYVWSPEQITEILGPQRAQTFQYVYDITPQGKGEGVNIPRLTKPIPQAAAMLGVDPADLVDELDSSRRALLAARENRVPPAKDTKILVSWNGMAIAALADATWSLRSQQYLNSASRAAEFILSKMRQPDGRLFRVYAEGQPRHNACLDDYAALVDGLVRLFEASGEPRWLEAALDVASILIAEFHDDATGGFFYTGKSHEPLLVRMREVIDNATPAAGALAATALTRLAAIANRDDLEEIAARYLQSVAWLLHAAPQAAAQSLIALDFQLGPTRQFVVVAGNDRIEYEHALEEIQKPFLPNKVVAPRPRPTEHVAPALRGMWADRPAREGLVTVYECREFACQAPYVGLESLRQALATSQARGA